MAYAPAFALQRTHVEEVLAARDAGRAEAGRILLVEHEPVITVSRRPEARGHLLADAARLDQLGVEIAETDRGGDITYHGPGQLVVYPILDLNRLNLGLHAYMRLLEQVVIDACTAWGIGADRDPGATGVWVMNGSRTAKIAAMGVRVRRWVSMHGLSFNVAPDMSHFGLIVPCGLTGRAVTSLDAELMERGRATVPFGAVKQEVAATLERAIRAAAAAADQAREASATNIPR